jgi:hypothetical protein
VALWRTRWRWTRPLRVRRYAIWLTRPTVEIRDAQKVLYRWEALFNDCYGYAFTRAQAKQIRAALADVIQAENDQVREAHLAIFEGEERQ